MNPQLLSVIAFLHETEKLKSTLRHNWTTSGRQESTAEHTWRLMVLFLLLTKLTDFHIDESRTLKMLLVHDLAECIYGDVPGFVKAKDSKDLARKREHEAAVKLFSTLPQNLCKEFLGLFEEYEQGKTQEALVAKALDKCETLLQHIEAGEQYIIPEERGDASLKYGEKNVKLLNNDVVNELYVYLQKEIGLIAS